MRIEGYDLLEKLGEGGMGTVWKACQVSLNRLVAVKVLSSSMASNPEDIERFYAEAKLMAQLRHPGVIQVYDFNVAEGCYYFVMEFVEGRTASDLLAEKKSLPSGEALSIVESVAEALQYAWDKVKIIHCDIKPDNIMIDTEGVVRVADLGLARTFSRIGRRDESEDVLGTPWYMSPEQIEGRSDLDCRSDIYSLGAMLYHMATGRMLFQGEKPDKVMELQLAGTVEDPFELNPKIPKPLCGLIEKMLAKKRALRHPDWGAVLADIKRVRKGLFPSPALLDEKASTVRRSAARRSAPTKRPLSAKSEGSKVPVVVGALAIGLALVLLMIWLANRPRRTRPPPMVNQTEIPTDNAGAQADQVYQSVETWARANPDRYDDAILRFRQILPQVRGSEYGPIVDGRIRSLENARQQAVRKVLGDLQQTAAPLAAKSEYAQAAAVYENYTGRLAAESEQDRRAAAKALRDQAGHQGMNAGEFDKLLDSLASTLVAKGAPGGREFLTQSLGKPVGDQQRHTLLAIQAILDNAAAIDTRILRSFEDKAGQAVQVELTDGKKILTVVRVESGRVVYREGSASGVSRTLAPGDLALPERLRRMGPDSLPEVALAKGLIALEFGATEKAREYFGKTHPALSDRLVAAVPK